MTDTGPSHADDLSCPKRTWVLMSLSDDEQTEPAGELRSGLRFHLSRCPACRELADRLLNASRLIADTSAGAPPDGLLARANEQALLALRSGGELTGRVEVADIEEPPSGRSVRRVYIWSARGIAAAAAIVLMVGIYWPAPSSQDAIPPANPPWVVEIPAESPRPSQTEESADVLVADSEDTSAEEPVAGRVADVKKKRQRPRRPNPRRFRSHIEAAECDDDTVILRAVILPHRSQRNQNDNG